MINKTYPISVKNALRHFGKIKALDDFSLTVKQGEFVGLIGPNGAGKSTLIGSLLGLVGLQGGESKLFGFSPGDIQGKATVGYLPEFFFCPDYLTPNSYLKEIGALHGMDSKQALSAAKDLTSLLGLNSHMDRLSGKLSKGLLRRVGIVRSLFHDPDLIIFDEPAWGLDPFGRKALNEILLDLKKQKKTLLLCSHNMEMVETVCDRFVFIENGKLKGEGSNEDLSIEDEVKIIYENKKEVIPGSKQLNGCWLALVDKKDRESQIQNLIKSGSKIIEVSENRTDLIDWVVSKSDRKDEV